MLLALIFLPLLPISGQTVVKPKQADLPPQDEIWYSSVTQTSESELKHLRGAAKLQTTEMAISADEIDFNSDTNWAYARGHVHMDHYATGDSINADHAEYNIRTEEGRFYVLNGTAPAKLLTNPFALTTTNPFYFQARWADRIKNRYILHHGFITDCKVPKPWWSFQSPQFDIVPGDHAIARHAVLFVHRIPILYLPYFLRPLGRNPRQSGFLTPNIGNSTNRGYLYGGGYYWAINRSYDLDYVLQDFTLRGPTHTVDFRGKPNAVSDFNFSFYAVQDKEKQGGQEFELSGRTQLLGFNAKLDYNFLSSYLFRQAFANSYSSALSAQVDSIGFMQRHFNHDLYSLNFVFERDELFENTLPKNNDVIVQKLPSAEFYGRDDEIAHLPIPLWFSFTSTASLESRVQGLGSSAPLNTGVTPRTNIEPRLSSEFHLAGFSFEPAVSVGLTDYGKAYANTPTVTVLNSNLLRRDADLTLEMHAPTLERVFTPPAWLHLGQKVKHVVEFNATYEYLTGINQFQQVIKFDQMDILSSTNQMTFNLSNRLYRKDKAGKVVEIFSWHLTQARYFDQTFGGAVIAGQSNTLLAALELSPYTFLSGPRNYSPIESALVFNASKYFNFEYRSAYDPLQHEFIDHAVSGYFKYNKIGATVTDTALTNKALVSAPNSTAQTLLVPKANQIAFGTSYGASTARGFNVGGNITYDIVLHQTLFEFVQTTYNTNCCGFSFQLRRYNFGAVTHENQYLFSFSLANLGTFGSMQRQDRIF